MKILYTCLLTVMCIIMAGCSPSPTIDNISSIDIGKEKQITQTLTKKLQETDPNVVSARYVFDSNGNRTIEVAKKDESENISLWHLPPEVIKNVEQQSAKQQSEGIDAGDFILGALSGYALSSMLSSPSQSFNQSQYNRHVETSSKYYERSISDKKIEFNRKKESQRTSMKNSKPNRLINTPKSSSFKPSRSISRGGRR